MAGGKKKKEATEDEQASFLPDFGFPEARDETSFLKANGKHVDVDKPAERTIKEVQNHFVQPILRHIVLTGSSGWTYH